MTSSSFLPHGFCYMWNKQLLALHVISDSLIFLSYVAIACTIAWLLRREKEHLPFSSIFLAFGAFIVACGFTHALDVVVLWVPLYWLSGDIKFITAIASVITAVALSVSMPKVRLLLKRSASSRLNELRLLGAAESSMDCLYFCAAVRAATGEIEDFVFTYVNSNAIDLVTFSKEELIGSRMCELLPVNLKLGLFEKYKQVVITGECFVGEFKIEEDTIHTEWLRVQAVKLEDGVAISASNITDRKRQDAALRKSEALLERIGRLTGAGGWELDLITNAVYWSVELYEIFGVPSDYLPTLEEGLKFYVPDDRIRIQEAIAAAVAGGSGWEMECTVVRTDGNKLPVRVVGEVEFENGKPIRLTGIVKDIAERVQEREALTAATDLIRTANERLTLATDSGGIGIWDWDIANNTLSWDNWMYRLYGLVPGEGPEPYARWTRHLHSDDRDSTERQLRDGVDGVRPYNTEFRIVWNDTSVHFIQATAVVIRDETGRPLRMIGTNSDVTVRTEAEQKLRKSYNEKDLLLREVHHRVKNNLAVISSLLYLQAEEEKDPHLSMVLEESQARLRSMALVHEALYRSDNIAEIDFGGYAGLLADRLFSSHHSPNESIFLTKNLEAVILPIDSAVPCGLILNELLVNSFKHAFPDGRHGSIEIAVKKTLGRTVTITVSDDGVGLGNTRESTSLGLHLIQALTAQIDGTLEIIPTHPGTRSCVTLEV